MIFVTVGTHEQQFNRLIEAVDNLKKDEIIQDDIFIQIGYSTYKPKCCEFKKLLSFNEMEEMYKRADLIITHGGPASFMKALELNKVPIVVPRQKKYDEHINDHQVEFVKAVEERFKNIIVVYDIEDLKKQLLKKLNDSDNGDDCEMSISNNKEFNNKLISILNEE